MPDDPILRDPPFTPDAGWVARLRLRATTRWPVKMVSNTLGMAAFFVVYFWVLHHPLWPVTVMPLTPLDRWVPFAAAALPLYLSLWLYVSLPLALLKDDVELASYGLATLALSGAGIAVFVLFPTAVPASGIDWAQHPSIAFLKSVDVGGNAFPSLHVAFAVFSGIWLGRALRETGAPRWARVLNAAWCVGIVYSTIATRQHVVLDAVAGALLGVTVAALHLRWLRGAELRRTRAPVAARVPSTA